MKERGCGEYLEQLASSAPTPGGGGASALAAALGIALGNMVGSLTLGKKKYADVEADIERLNAKAQAVRAALLDLAAADEKAFEPLSRAYAIPKEAAGRDEVMEAALLTAAGVPMEIMRKTAEALVLIGEYAKKGSKLVISDAGCAAALCRAALSSAALNVFVNTGLMKDREKAAALNCEAEELLKRYGDLADGIYNEVRGRL